MNRRCEDMKITKRRRILGFTLSQQKQLQTAQCYRRYWDKQYQSHAIRDTQARLLVGGTFR